METAPDPDTKILVLGAIKPEQTDTGQLSSPNLEQRLAEYDPHLNTMWAAFLDSEPGSLDEAKYAKSIAKIYMLNTAQEQQATERDKSLWAERYTESSGELYGLPNPELAGEIAAIQLSAIEDIELDDEDSLTRLQRVKDFLGGKHPSISEKEPDARGIELLPELREVLRELFADLHKPIVEVLRDIEEGPYTSERAREIFTDIIVGYEADNPSWAEWEVTNTPNKTSLSVVAPKKQIDVPDGRADIPSKEKLVALAYHEIGVHAFRSVMGYESGDEKLATGLPDYIDFEEGLGVFAEYLFTGKIPEKIEDRYVDIALALGIMDGSEPAGRLELIQFAVDRQVLRDRNEGKIPDIETITAEAEAHINRIFRGGDGELHSKPSGELAQAIFTKDMVYMEGFIKVAGYIESRIEAGDDIDEVWADLLSGKFDPTDPSHVKYKNEVLAG